jgi:glycosyltransferase involved in cell wall biosynthesis
MNPHEQPPVAICVPVFNGEKYLHECLNSIMLQTYSNWVCVVNNNCSTDKSYEIALSFQEKDNRFRVYTNDNFIPVVPNWNKAFFYADKNARYFKMVQADDWLYPECIEEMVALFETDPEIGLCSSFRIDSKYPLPAKFDVYEGKVFHGKDMLYRHLSHQLDIVGSITTVMFAMEFLKKLERFPKIFDDSNYHIDSELDYEIMYMSKVGFIPKILSYTRRHSESGTSTIVHKLGTLHQHNELVLSRYRDIHPNVAALYKKARYDYAYFMLKSRLLHKVKTIEWHRKYFKGSFSGLEYLIAFATRNGFVGLTSKILRKIKSKL